MKICKQISLYAAGLALLFTACGGDSAQTAAQDPEQSGTQQEADVTVAAAEELPNCTEKREGQTALVTEDSSTYLCGSGKWVFVSAPTPTVESLDDLSNCSASKEGDTVKVESESAIFRCEDGKWEKYRALTDTLVSAEDLLACVSKREGNTAYVVDEHSLYSCEDGAWNRTVTFMDTTSSKDDLPNCTQKNEGDSSYVSKEKAVYLCIEGAWRHLGGVASTSDELPNCTEKREGSRTLVVAEHVTLVCGEGKWYRYDIFQDIEEEKARAKSSSSSSQGKQDDWEEFVPKSSSSKTKSSSSTVSPTSNSVDNSSSSMDSVVESSSSQAPISHEKISTGDDLIWANSTYMTDARDNERYRIVNVGDQTWMAENLRYKGHKTGESYCYEDDEKNCSVYGRLYTWDAVMDGSEGIPGSLDEIKKNYGLIRDSILSGVGAIVQGICPDNWHVPTLAEWMIFHSGYLDFSWRNGQSNSLAFSVKPSGHYHYQYRDLYRDEISGYENGWNYVYHSAAFWTSNEYGHQLGLQYYWFENSGIEEEGGATLYKSTAISLRCVRDTQLSFDPPTLKKNVTPSGIVYDSEGTEYNTVQIGSQVWMSENVKGSGSCPDGFHVPYPTEWNFLLHYVEATNGDESVFASLMAENVQVGEEEATDSYGFSAVPAESDNLDSGYVYFETTPSIGGGVEKCIRFDLNKTWNPYSFKYGSDCPSEYSISVRCIKD